MTVQSGEGTMEIIYGSTSIPAGPEIFGGYLARPDGIGEWPTVIVFGPEPTPTSSVRNICRMLARNGIAALAPDLTTDHADNEAAAAKIATFITDPSGHWSNAQLGYGALAFGYGVYDAAAHAARGGDVVAVAAIGATFDEIVVEDLTAAGVPTLYVGSRGDDTTDVDVSLARRDDVPFATFVVYQDAEAGWWDDDADGFDEDLSRDTFDRVLAFFTEHLPEKV